MLTIDVPLLELFDVQLQPDPPELKRGGGAHEEGPDVPLVVSLGKPQVQRVTAELAGKDEALKAFLAAEKEHRYYLLHVACSFDPDHDIRKAWLRASLHAGSGEPPIAWSMDPLRRGSKVTLQQKVALGASLKFAEIGANIGEDTTVTTDFEKPFLEAYHELQSDPYWAFTATDETPLRGSYRLSMVVKARAGRAAKADVTLRATVQRKKFGLIPYEIPAEAEPRLSVRLD
jgi:hypothetical protein